MDLADRVKTARARLNLSQTALAKLCGMSAPSVSEIESRKTKSLRGNTLLRFASALQVDPQWLLSGGGDLPDLEQKMTTGERGLVDDFRKLSSVEQRIVVRMIRALAIDK